MDKNVRDGGHESADFADVNPESIRDLKETLLEERGGSVSNHAITLHLSESETTISRTTFDGLPRHDLHRPTGASVDLVVHHVAQTLVVCRPKEDLGAQLPPRVPVVHDLETARLVPMLPQEVRDAVDRDLGEGCGIALHALEGGHLGKQALDQMGDGHTRRNGVRVDDDVGCDALGGERHVLLAVGHSNSSFLTVTGSKFIADLRNLGGSDPDFDVSETILVCSHDNLIYDTTLGAAQRR